jgi:hypothetical protein
VRTKAYVFSPGGTAELQTYPIKFEKRLGSATTLYGNVVLSLVIPSEAEGSAVLRISPGNAKLYSNRIVISTGAYPDFLPRCTGNDRVCAFQQPAY